jgi:hypothetical protein
MRKTQQDIRILGFIEIGQEEARLSGEKQKRVFTVHHLNCSIDNYIAGLHVPLVKVNLDGPSLDLSVEFSMLVLMLEPADLIGTDTVGIQSKILFISTNRTIS